MALIETLTDSFSGVSLDAQWSSYTSYGSTITVSGGKVVLSRDASGQIFVYSTASNYDLTDSYGFVEIFDIITPSSASPSVVYGLYTTPGWAWEFQVQANNLETAYGLPTPPYYYTKSTRAYNSVAHRFMRIRAAVVSGVPTNTDIFWDVSPDGVTWTNIDSLTVLTTDANEPVLAQLEVGAFNNGFSFDNFNTVPATTTSTSSSISTSSTSQSISISTSSTSSSISVSTSSTSRSVSTSSTSTSTSVSTSTTVSLTTSTSSTSSSVSTSSTSRSTSSSTSKSTSTSSTSSSISTSSTSTSFSDTTSTSSTSSSISTSTTLLTPEKPHAYINRYHNRSTIWRVAEMRASIKRNR